MTFSNAELTITTVAVLALLVAVCFSTATDAGVPADKFDLSEWNITLPLDKNRDGKPDTVTVRKIQKYSHPDFFYLDENGYMVFASPNKAQTTKNSSNTRSELRHMLRGTDTRIKTKAPKNNFTVAANPHAKKFGSIGGKMEATLKVDHVAKRAGYPKKATAYSVVVGQIHAGTYKPPVEGFGWGNEPLKIYYKKWPEHDKGSVFWTYEKNLPKNDPNRKDVAFPVWGNDWKNPEDPGEAGVSLGEEFSYTVNVYKNVMYLRFEAPNRETKEFAINLAKGIDEVDHKWGYAGEWMYFKAGAYNQCSTKKAEGFWYTACEGTGNWEEDKANGDYAQVSFSRLVVGESTPLE